MKCQVKVSGSKTTFDMIKWDAVREYLLRLAVFLGEDTKRFVRKFQKGVCHAQFIIEIGRRSSREFWVIVGRIRDFFCGYRDVEVSGRIIKL